MEATILALRLILAVIFGVAGVSKFADLAGSRKALAGFGAPERLTPSISVLLPTVEMVVAVALLFIETSWFGAICGLVLLLVFSGGMIFQMSRGNAPDCHCFGQLHSEPVGAKSLIRNIVIMVPAIILVAFGEGNQGLPLSKMGPDLVQLFAVIFGVVLLAGVFFYQIKISNQQTQIIRRIEVLELISRDGIPVERDAAGSPHDGLPIGAVLPEVELKDLEGQAFSTRSLKLSGRPSLLFFVSPTCEPCKALVPTFDRWADDLREKLDIVFISSGTAEENAEKFAAENDKKILLQIKREFADLVNARWTPAAVLVSADGRIASHTAAGDSAIGELVEKIKSSGMTNEFDYFELGNGYGNLSERNVEIGETVPAFEITTMDGKAIGAADLRGKQTLVTFWSPTCPHCMSMLDQIKSWDNTKGEDEPDLLIFSDGEEDRHRELGLSSPIILDKEYKIAAKLGMYGTPSAILVNKEGRFASETAVGAPNIWALIGKRMTDFK